MRNVDRLLFLPLFAALAIGCSGPTSMQSSEYDDVYYSKKDKTIITDNTIAAATNQAENQPDKDGNAANPEYSEKNSGTGSSAANQDYYSTDYDEEDYYYASRIRRFHTPYRGLSYYDFAYTDYYWYNRSPYYYGRSMAYDPFYSAYRDPFFPCYTCYGYPYYGGLTIVIGRPYGGWYGNPYYGGGFNRGWGGFGGGFGNYYGNNNWYRNDNGNNSRNVQYGRRTDRSNTPIGSDGNAPARPRGEMGGTIPGGGRVVNPAETDPRMTRSTRGTRTADNPDQPASPTMERTDRSRGRLDRTGNVTQIEQVPAPVETGRTTRRPSEMAPGPAEQRTTAPETPVRSRERRTYEPQPTESRPTYQPQRQERSEPSYSPPSRQERSQPAYTPPARQERSEPSYSPPPQRQERSSPAPSSSGSGDGGSRSSRSRGN